MDTVIDLKNRNTIQIMRGIAIIMVVLHHSLSLIETSRISDVTVHFVDMMHVNIFFVISGYLFQKSAAKYRKLGFKNFLVKKIRELFIPYYILSLVFAMLIRIASMKNSIGTILAAKGYMAKSLFAILVDPLIFRNPYFTSLWYIYVLMIYFIVSWVFVNRNIKLLDLFLLGMIGIVANMFFWQYMPDILYKTFRYYLFFTAGMWISLQCGSQITIKKKLWWASIGILALSLFRNIMIDLSRLTVLERNIETQVERVLTASAAIVVCACVASKIVNRKQAHPLIIIGDMSYAIYLLHNPWVICVVALVAQKVGLNQSCQLILIMVCGIGLPMLVNTILLHAKEKMNNGYKNELP